MLASRLPVLAVISIAAAGCTAAPIFPPQPPASFCSYPVTGALGSISVADLETVTAAAKPHKIYGVNIAGHNELSIQITPTRHGSNSHLEFKRVQESWRETGQTVITGWSQLSTRDEKLR